MSEPQQMCKLLVIEPGVLRLQQRFRGRREFLQEHRLVLLGSGHNTNNTLLHRDSFRKNIQLIRQLGLFYRDLH